MYIPIHTPCAPQIAPFPNPNRSSKIRGGKLPEGMINPAGGPSITPLLKGGTPLDDSWMGLSWSENAIFDRRTIKLSPKGPGVYRIINISTEELLYIGESRNVKTRILEHTNKDWGNGEITFSYAIFRSDILDHQLKEIENDLIASYFSDYKTVPPLQIKIHQPYNRNGDYGYITP
jgi:hypothetical protein